MREGRVYSFEEPKPCRTIEEARERAKHIRWSEVWVESENFGKLPLHERLRQMAFGYLRSAKSQCIELGEHPDRLDWPRASAAIFAYHHSYELFLKACILYRVPVASEKMHHSVPKLLKRYHELYPVDKFFAFDCFWWLDFDDLDEMVGGKALVIEDFEKKEDQVFRYFSGKVGESPKALHIFAPGVWLDMIEHTEEDMIRVWENILEQYPQSS